MAKTNPLLPRLVDTSGISDIEFRGWLMDTAGLLPKRHYEMSEGQLVEEEDSRGVLIRLRCASCRL